MVEPPDAFDFFANLKAIPFHNQILTMILAVVGAIVVAVNTLVGIHDQLVPEPNTLLYSHYDTDGDSVSPFINSLTTSGFPSNKSGTCAG